MVKRDKTHWNTRFSNKDTPWEEAEPSLHLTEILNNYTLAGQSLKMTLRDIALSIEENFEVLEIKRGIFGKRNNFLS